MAKTASTKPETAYDRKVKALATRLARFDRAYSEFFDERYDSFQDCVDDYTSNLEWDPREVAESLDSTFDDTDHLTASEFRREFGLTRGEATALVRDCWALARERPARAYGGPKARQPVKRKAPPKHLNGKRRVGTRYSNDLHSVVNTRPIRMESARTRAKRPASVGSKRRLRTWSHTP